MLTKVQEYFNISLFTDRELRMFFAAQKRPAVPIVMTDAEKLMVSKGLRRVVHTPPIGSYVIGISIARRTYPYDAILGEYTYFHNDRLRQLTVVAFNIISGEAYG